MEQEKEEKEGKTKREERIKVPKNPFLGIDPTKSARENQILRWKLLNIIIYTYVYEY